MEVTPNASLDENQAWGGGIKPLNASYGKMMMWFFIVSDALTFTGFLVSYGFSRFKNINSWPIADEVFTHFPFLHGIDAPMYYVALMTFVLIFSSVTMVLAVDAGHHMNKAKVTFYMLLTIIGGLIFVGSQAWEWKNFIKGEYGALETRGGQILQFLNIETGKRAAIQEFSIGIDSERSTHQSYNGIWYKILSRDDSLVKIEEAIDVVEGANLIHNEYGNRLFADFFFFITGFHGFHVFSGVVINVIIFFNVILGTYERRGHYEMVEKVGLYWHFVDLVWVFVFTFFYLV